MGNGAVELRTAPFCSHWTTSPLRRPMTADEAKENSHSKDKHTEVPSGIAARMEETLRSLVVPAAAATATADRGPSGGCGGSGSGAAAAAAATTAAFVDHIRSSVVLHIEQQKPNRCLQQQKLLLQLEGDSHPQRPRAYPSSEQTEVIF